MLGFLSKIFGGNKSDKDVQRIQPIVTSIHGFSAEYKLLNNDQLRNNTNIFKDEIKEYLSEINVQIESKKEEAASLDDGLLTQKEELYKEIDDLKLEKDKHLEEILNTILPKAFATIKEAASRFKAHSEITSEATDLDKELAGKGKTYISIAGTKAIYQNKWLAAGIEVVWNMVHYDVQLVGGIVLHQGKIAEMSTGEGKTLVSTLPSYLNALAGEGVHLVTVNDYLAKRDAEWNGPLFEWLGITVDCIDKHRPNSDERKNAYLADITYGTNNEFGFDFLRDNMVHNPDEMVQRKHHFAMVDEVDSVLIDDARTPLIISGPVPRGDDQQFHLLKPKVLLLFEQQRKLVNGYLSEAKKKIAENNDDPKDGGLALMRAFRGLPKNSALIKLLSEPGIKVKLQKIENYYLADQSKEMPKVDEGLLFYIDEKNNQVDLTDKGLQFITGNSEDAEFFVLPDLSIRLAEIDKSEEAAELKLQKKESLLNEYAQKADRIHTVQQLLKAYTLFEKDVEYVVMDESVKIVDEQTGRILDGRRYSDGLHQAIEAKENVTIEAATQTYATITLQNYFRMYHKLAGMTGTAETEAGELWDIYKLDVVSIPTNLPLVRLDHEDKVYKTKREKYKAVIEEIDQLRSSKRPVLVGTTDVSVSELLSRMLTTQKIPHNVLNAKQHAREAQIVAEAGFAGNVTIATNMAGRGTDIKLGPGVKEAGGLAIVGTERHDSRRVDRQLRGRSGRQGDPGSSQFFVSLEDDLMRMFGSDRLAGLMDRMGYEEGEVIQHSMITKSIERAQKKVEENNFGVRKRLLEYDDVMNKQRAVIYSRRRHALFGDRLALDIDNAFYNVVSDLVTLSKESNRYEDLQLATIRQLAIEPNVNEAEFSQKNSKGLNEPIYIQAIENYSRKKADMALSALPIFQNIRQTQGQHIRNVVVPISDGTKQMEILVDLKQTIDSKGKELPLAMEKGVALGLIDNCWKEHLRSMDDLKQSVQTAHYEQKDPLVIYKIEAFNLFRNLETELNKDLVQFLCHASIPVQQPLKEGIETKTDLSNLRQQKAELDTKGREEINNGEAYHDPTPQAKQQPVAVGPKIGRNDPCPCGSGKKFKQCHGKE